MKIVICDIDNCYTDSREWIAHAPQVSDRNKDENRALWDEYRQYANLAKPNKTVIDLVSTLSFFFPIFFLTSREDRGESREITIKQIEEFSEDRIKISGRNKLLMRDEHDFRLSDETKQDMVRALIMDCEPVIAIDDDMNNCKMFKRHNIPTYRYDIETDTFEVV